MDRAPVRYSSFSFRYLRFCRGVTPSPHSIVELVFEVLIVLLGEASGEGLGPSRLAMVGFDVPCGLGPSWLAML